MDVKSEEALVKPTEILIEEHRVIEQVLAALEKAVTRMSRGENVHLRFFSGTSYLLNGFTDRYHHKKEERVLLPALVEIGLSADNGFVAAMITEHEEARRLAQRLRQVTDRFLAGDVNAREQVILSALGYVSLLRRHMYKEDHGLFPLVEQVIPADRQNEMAAAFERFDLEENGSELHEKYYEMANRLAQECGR